jgi:HEPN domain-containing protein
LSPKTKKYKPEYAHQLLRIADGDLQSAKILATAAGGRPENIIYTAQQSIEKALKAVICFSGQSLILTHDIEVLLSLLDPAQMPDNPELLASFTQYATVRRYEEGFEILTKEDFQQAIQAAESVIKWARGIIR